MANARATVKQADLTRALKAFTAAGIPVGRARVKPGGEIIIETTGATDDAGDNPCDVLLKP